MKKIDKLKKFFCKSYRKKISQPLIQPSISRPERTERSYLIHAITLRGATTLCARLDIKARYAHFSPSPPLIYDEAIEKSLLAFPPFYIRQLVLDATRFFRRLKVAASSTPSSPDILSSSTSSSVVRGGEETISRGASLRSAQVSLVDNAQREARVHDKLLARLTVLSVNEISCSRSRSNVDERKGKRYLANFLLFFLLIEFWWKENGVKDCHPFLSFFGL